MKKSDAVIMIGSTSVTLLIALLLIRWLAPSLLGIAPDLQMVQVAREIPPFYKNVFRQHEHVGHKLLIPEPELVHRGNPGYGLRGFSGPHDILGFRNRNVPRYADVVIIGDSQTYGNNAVMELNWPSQLEYELQNGQPARVYNISTGGWGPLQYLGMLDAAAYFSPRVLIVAFYMGNDPIEAFRLAYGSERWEYLRPERDLSGSDLPPVQFPPPEDEMWFPVFPDGLKTGFTPELRLASNESKPAIDAGHEILRKVGTEIARRVSQWQEPPVLLFTVIPTKELVYARRVQDAGIQPTPAYQQLVAAESAHIQRFREHVGGLPNTHYVDLVEGMQITALSSKKLYPENANGHPMQAGYRAIAQIITARVTALLTPLQDGLVQVMPAPDPVEARFALIENGRFWRIMPAESTGLPDSQPLAKLPTVHPRILSNLDYLGLIKTDVEELSVTLKANGEK